MMEADVIVFDALVPQAIVDMGRRDAERLSVGKRKGCHSKSQEEINDLLVDLGKAGKRVVRLKSGDPLVYGRAGEEMAALRQAGVTYEVVPGITSAFAASSARMISSNFSIGFFAFSGSRKKSKPLIFPSSGCSFSAGDIGIAFVAAKRFGSSRSAFFCSGRLA